MKTRRVIPIGMICSPALTRTPVRPAHYPSHNRPRSDIPRTPVLRSVHSASVPVNFVSTSRRKSTSLSCSASAESMALQGRVAVVTGASRGIGRTIAQKLAGEGARLALAARSTDSLKQASFLSLGCARLIQAQCLQPSDPKIAAAESHIVSGYCLLEHQILRTAGALIVAVHHGLQHLVCVQYVKCLVLCGEQVAEECMKAGAEGAEVFPVDLSDVDALEQFAQDVLKKYSKVDVLVNNAGMMPKTDGASGEQGSLTMT